MMLLHCVFAVQQVMSNHRTGAVEWAVPLRNNTMSGGTIVVNYVHTVKERLNDALDVSETGGIIAEVSAVMGTRGGGWTPSNLRFCFFKIMPPNIRPNPHWTRRNFFDVACVQCVVWKLPFAFAGSICKFGCFDPVWIVPQSPPPCRYRKKVLKIEFMASPKVKGCPHTTPPKAPSSFYRDVPFREEKENGATRKMTSSCQKCLFPFLADI